MVKLMHQRMQNNSPATAHAIVESFLYKQPLFMRGGEGKEKEPLL